MQAKKQFDKLGFPVVFSETKSQDFDVNVRRKKDGKETFDVKLRDGVDLVVLDTKPEERALLVMFKNSTLPINDQKLGKYLLGHDERELFVSAVSSSSKSVIEAKESLKPGRVKSVEKKSGVKAVDKQKHKNKARVRQGEFFFIPAPNAQINENLVLKNEPLFRGSGRFQAGKPHMAEELYRTGGTPVMVSRESPAGISETRYRQLVAKNPEAAKQSWTRRVQNPTVYVRGKITHPDHKTVVLKVWNLVSVNEEAKYDPKRRLSFID
jgi:hypothetical protein